MTHVIFVCTANICRSPMAEGIFRHLARESGRSDLHATSMGTHGFDNQPASDLARQVCQENGIDISAHRSRSLQADELRDADLVLCMEAQHRQFVQTFFPWYRDKVFLAGAWPGKENRKSGIDDPIGAPLEVYRIAFGVIRKHMERITRKL